MIMSDYHCDEDEIEKQIRSEWEAREEERAEDWQYSDEKVNCDW